MAAVFVTNRVECWVRDGFYRNGVREEGREGEEEGEEEGENLEDRCACGYRRAHAGQLGHFHLQLSPI